jgi:imidazolonepropionase-like amidohydrolase
VIGQQPLAVRGGIVVDGTGRDARHADIFLDRGRFTAVRQASSNVHASQDNLDAAGLTVLPGLIDAHSHLGLLGPLMSGPAALTAARIFRNCELALEAGFTTVRDVGGLDGAVAEAIGSGLVRGPRILPSGPIICRTGGHGDHSPAFFGLPTPESAGIAGLTKMACPVDGPDAMRAATRTALRRGATQLKLCVTAGFDDYEDRSFAGTELCLEELKAAVEEADAAATYVTAHAHHARGIRHGLEAGVSCFEHGTFLDEETAQAMAAAGAMLVPTLAVVHVLTDGSVPSVPEHMTERARLFEESMLVSMKLARDAGVVIGSGSDFTGVEQNRRGLEISLRAGIVGPMEAILMATSANARVLRRADLVGTIEPGKLADLVAVEGDPLLEPELFDDPARVRLVVKDGVVVKDTR